MFYASRVSSLFVRCFVMLQTEEKRALLFGGKNVTEHYFLHNLGFHFFTRLYFLTLERAALDPAGGPRFIAMREETHHGNDHLVATVRATF